MAEMILLFLFASLFFWLWMIVDCTYHERESDKSIWLVIIFMTVMVGALAYLILRYRANRQNIVIQVDSEPET